MDNVLISLKLPFPITVNHFYNRRGHYTFISEKGLAFNKKVLDIVDNLDPEFIIDSPIAMEIYVVEPDKRRRDLDNLTKSCLDSLVKARLISDDHIIHDLRIYKTGEVVKGAGYVVVTIKKII